MRQLPSIGVVASPALGVQMWLVDLELHALLAEPGVLDAHERARARRFATTALARRFVARRHALRTVLGRCSGRAPGDVVLLPGPFGKPALPGDALQFNLSHSDRFALVAVSSRKAVGVDVETLRPLPDAAAIMARAFSPAERESLARHPCGNVHQALLWGWTRKEACVKALGCGLSWDPRSFDVCSGAPWSVRLGNGAQAHRLRLYSLSVAPSLQASLAVCE